MSVINFSHDGRIYPLNFNSIEPLSGYRFRDLLDAAHSFKLPMYAVALVILNGTSERNDFKFYDSTRLISVIGRGEIFSLSGRSIPDSSYTIKSVHYFAMTCFKIDPTNRLKPSSWRSLVPLPLVSSSEVIGRAFFAAINLSHLQEAQQNQLAAFVACQKAKDFQEGMIEYFENGGFPQLFREATIPENFVAIWRRCHRIKIAHDISAIEEVLRKLMLTSLDNGAGAIDA